MPRSNSTYANAVREYEPGLPKFVADTDMARKVVFFSALISEIRGVPLIPADEILDFGCGGGMFCEEMWSQGFSVQGVDIFEYWGDDRDILGEVGPKFSDQQKTLLHKIDVGTNVLPFADNSMDVVISDQTLEHVFDYRPVFSEQVRVLKPGGIAVHRFPHGHSIREPHTRILLTALTGQEWYLKMNAKLGIRNSRQRGFTAEETLISNRRLMSSVNYATRSHIIKCCEGLGLSVVKFVDGLDCGDNRAAHLLRASRKFGLSVITRPVLSYLQDNQIFIFQKS